MFHEKYGNVIEIWQPRYKDNTCLISTLKVKRGKNYITFTKAKHLANKIFEVDGAEVRKCSTQPNGKIDVYIVPMSKLELVEEIDVQCV